jgi:hypothetical protein
MTLVILIVYISNQFRIQYKSHGITLIQVSDSYEYLVMEIQSFCTRIRSATIHTYADKCKE